MDDQFTNTPNPTPPNNSTNPTPPDQPDGPKTPESPALNGTGVSNSGDQTGADGPHVTGPSQSAKPKSGLMKWLAVLVVLLLVGGGAYMAMNRDKKPSQPAAQTPSKKSVALLRVGVTQPFISDFYPKSETSILPLEVNAQIFEGLTKYQNENQVVPNLATSWTNPNNTTWDFKLKPNVKFHDGHDLTAQAVKASIEALMPTDYGKSYASTIKTVTAKDNLTVEIVTSAPDPLLPTELANLWIYDTASGKDNDPTNGTGPYTIKPGTSLTKDSLDLAAVSDYHGGTPLTKEIQLKYYADDKTITQDVKNGQLEIADLTAQSAVNDVKQYGYASYVDKLPIVYFLIPNSQRANSPLQKLAVRKALYEGLDPLAIMKADERTGTAATQFVPQEIPGYNPNIQRPKTDATQAKTDLAAAGYPNGFTITFTYFAPHAAMAAEVQKEMTAMGVKLTMDPQTNGAALQKKATGGQTDMFYFGFGSNLIDSSDVIEPLLVDSANYKNADLTKSFQEASTTLDTVKRLQLLQQVNKAAMDDVAGFPLFVPDGTYFAVKSNLNVHTDNLTNYMGIDFWKVYSN
jgi:peptide/nickel transport system substrate-binding protein